MIVGRVKKDKKTKKLRGRLLPGDIAVLSHLDLDRTATQMLISRRIKAVLNDQDYISGRFPNQAPLSLIKSDIPLFIISKEIRNKIKENDIVEIKDNKILTNNQILGTVEYFSFEKALQKNKLAYKNYNIQLDKFIDNTIKYMTDEKTKILNSPYFEGVLDFENKYILVIVRGAEYKRDLHSLLTFIKKKEPVILAVDGAADGCLSLGILPDIIIGDMDSVSKQGLLCGAKLIVHAYPDGSSPGLKRLKKLGLSAQQFSFCGTSEDIALLLADQLAQEKIFMIGSHTGMIEFLEKGRPGMGSTLLTRIKVNQKLVDLKGINLIF